MPSFVSCNLYLRKKITSLAQLGKFLWLNLSVCRAFFSYNPYLRDKSRSAHWTIINIYFVWKNYQWAFLDVSVKNHVLLLLNKISFKKSWHKQFFLKMAEFWGINIYVIWKTTIVPLSVCNFFERFLVIMSYLRDKSRSFLLTGRYFVKNDFCSQAQAIFSQNGGRLGYKYLWVLWKTTINIYVHLSVCRAFFRCIISYLREKSRSSFAQQDVNFFQEIMIISNFFSKWRNSVV